MTTKITSRSLLQRLIGTAIMSLACTGISVQASLSSSQSKHVDDISLPKESILDSFGKETLLAVGLDTSTLGKFRAKTTLTADDTAAFVEGQGISKTFGVNSGA